MTGKEERPAPDDGGRRPAGSPGERSPGRTDRDVALAELVSRVVERGVVVTGEVVISVAGVDLVYLGLDVLLAATDRLNGDRDVGGTGSDAVDPNDGTDPDGGAPPEDDD